MNSSHKTTNKSIETIHIERRKEYKKNRRLSLREEKKTNESTHQKTSALGYIYKP